MLPSTVFCSSLNLTPNKSNYFSEQLCVCVIVVCVCVKLLTEGKRRVGWADGGADFTKNETERDEIRDFRGNESESRNLIKLRKSERVRAGEKTADKQREK